MRKIKIRVYTDKPGDDGLRELEAFSVAGGFAIHKPLGCTRVGRDGWYVTHLATGSAVGRLRTQKQAQRFAAACRRWPEHVRKSADHAAIVAWGRGAGVSFVRASFESAGLAPPV